jgi:hypothetical protein
MRNGALIKVNNSSIYADFISLFLHKKCQAQQDMVPIVMRCYESE